MTALEARNRVKKSKTLKVSKVDEIYKGINEAVCYGYFNTFFDKFNISKEDKEIIENDGYFVSTRYTKGFEIRWYEINKDYFLSIALKQDSHYLKTDSTVIENYMKLQEF